MIANDTVFRTLDSGYWTGAALALTVYRPTRTKMLPEPRRDEIILQLTSVIAVLRGAIREAWGAHRTGSDRVGWAIIGDVTDM